MSLIDEMKEHYAEIPTMVTIHDYQERRLSLFVRAITQLEQADKMCKALEDMLSGWKYIRSTHGDLYGVGWDRAQEKAEQALSTEDNQ